MQLKPSADGVVRFRSPSKEKKPGEKTRASKELSKSSKKMTSGLPPAASFLTKLLSEEWASRLDVKPSAPHKPAPPEEEWFIPEFDIELRTATVNDFVKLCGCGLAEEAAAVLAEHPAWDINAINDVGDTALHAACYHGHIDTVIFLLDKPNINVDMENDGWRPLHIAADRGDLEVLQLLLSRGANPNAPGQGGLTPLHLACLKDHVRVAEELVVEQRVDVNATTVGNRTVHDGHETALHLAAMAGAFPCVDLLLCTAGTAVNARTAMGWTALHIAAEHGRTDTVALLLWYAKWNAALGIVVNAQNCGWTPLHLACDEGHVEILLLLIMCGGADPNFKDFGCFGALHVAAAQGHTAAVMALLQHRNLDVDIRTDGGSTALHIACEHHHLDVVKVLLYHGANPDLATVTGDTPLHTVADKGSVPLWQLLLSAGVNVLTPNHAGVTPQDLAAAKGHDMSAEAPKLEFTSLLECVEHNDLDAARRFMAVNPDPAFTNATDRDGRTALHAAAEGGQCALLAHLLAQPGIKLNAQTHTGNTALHLVAALGHRRMAKKLLAQRTIDANILNHGWTPVSLHNMMPESHVYAAFDRTKGLQGVYVHDGREPLHAACGAGYALITKMLLHHPDGDVNARSRGYQTALHLAAERGDVDMVEMLMSFRQHELDVNATDGNGATPLHDACRNGHLPVINRLLAHPSTDVNAMTTRYSGQRCYNKRCGSGTPLHVACEYGHAEAARLLLRHPDIDPSLPTPWGGATPLHVAAAAGLVEAVLLLLTFDGVAINALQDDGLTAWDVALKHGQERVLEVLTPVNAKMPPGPSLICANSALELQDQAIGRYCADAEYIEGPGCTVLRKHPDERIPTAQRQGYPAVVRFQSTGKGYDPDSVSIIGDWNEWNHCTAAPLTPIPDKRRGVTWIAILQLPEGENPVQMVIDGALGADTHRQGHRTLEGLLRCNLVVCTPPTMPSLAKCVEGTRIKELPAHDRKVKAPLAPPAAVPPHEYLERPAPPRPPMATLAPEPRATPPEPESMEEPRRGEASLGVEVKFFRDHSFPGQKVPVVVAMKHGGPAEQAGFMIDDVVQQVDGHAVTSKQLLAQIIAHHKPGDQVPVRLSRSNMSFTVDVTLERKTAGAKRVSWQGPQTSRYSKRRPRALSHAFAGLALPEVDLGLRS